MSVAHMSDATLDTLFQLVGTDRATIGEMFRARCKITPDAVFLIWEGKRWTYADAWREAKTFALAVAASATGGSVCGMRVATYLPNRPEAFFVALGVQVAGAVYVPLNRQHKGVLLADMLARSSPQLVVADQNSSTDLSEALPDGSQLLLVTEDDAELLGSTKPTISYSSAMSSAVSTSADMFHIPGASDTAIIMYTSGTTGRSKAVLLPHAMFTRGGAYLADAFGYQSDDVLHAWMPHFHIAGQLHTLCAAIVSGAAIALFPTFSASRFWNQIADTGATAFSALPNVLAILENAPPMATDSSNTLRVGLAGMLTEETRERFERRFGVTLYDQYGMTEVEPVTLPLKSRRVPSGSAGVAGPDYEITILDVDDMEQPAGALGEICVRPLHPDVMMKSYEGDSDTTVAQWRNLWWHTGDLGSIDSDGFIYVRGRIKHMIRRRGENISSAELESILAQHPNVADCAAVGIPSPLGDEDVKAVLVPGAGEVIDPVAFHTWCAARMAHFMVPRFIEIRDELPYSGIGKVDKNLLKLAHGALWDAETVTHKQPLERQL